MSTTPLITKKYDDREVSRSYYSGYKKKTDQTVVKNFESQVIASYKRKNAKTQNRSKNKLKQPLPIPFISSE